jgi:hypothetical protein
LHGRLALPRHPSSESQTATDRRASLVQKRTRAGTRDRVSLATCDQEPTGCSPRRIHLGHVALSSTSPMSEP